MNIRSSLFLSFTILYGLLLSLPVMAQDTNPLEGRWDLVIAQEGKELPSWLEIRHSGNHTLVGRFVYAFGSARPIAEVKVKDGKFSFAIPPQWEPGERYMEFEGQLQGETLTGTMVYTDRKTYSWTGVRAPQLAYTNTPVWGATQALFNGKNLNGWHAMGAENQWIVEEGILKSPKSGANLVSDATFTDFKLNVEFRIPEGSNSGIYLRGRYEVQIMDSKGQEPSDVLFGGVYGFLTPNEQVAKSPREWQTFDITLIGRRLTLVANGKTIINDQIIPGITGGALDSKEETPGPFMIQGDHGPVEFRKIEVTPMAKL
ncbi:DUF1080 domain-containing protein [Arenibacter sp. GZD96]|uniref:3-keto-disaccharide hydrolase n=1 Tax=Aurantibrevibacter litoralis TaxID=3106030 RepID=UPI002AFFA04D|nr:DUF1080 domain-containing protein [Arenibacter sp. GZD-96]MEA1787227.1 DUF1080 domain-containing protein [Arenibacter sp. GZD-96]